VSLNHKRRIFRENSVVASAFPPRGVALAAAVGGTAILLWVGVLYVRSSDLYVRSSDAPAWTAANNHVSAAADELAVLDGNTLRVGAHVVRLAGIVAPVRGSVCHAAGQMELDCGSAAANALAALVRGRAVACTIHGHDRHGRPMADCSAAGEPLGVALVRTGWARADAVALREPEATARAAGRGVWNSGS
jgi:endonuclease YncB( thermonuclease family)